MQGVLGKWTPREKIFQISKFPGFGNFFFWKHWVEYLNSVESNKSKIDFFGLLRWEVTLNRNAAAERLRNAYEFSIEGNRDILHTLCTNFSQHTQLCTTKHYFACHRC